MRFALAAAATLLVFTLAAHADPVTYSLTGTFSGTLGNVTFTDATGTFKLLSDTSDVTALGAGYYVDTTGLSTFSVDGIGTAAILSTTFGALGEFDGAGFTDLDTGFNVGIYDPTLGDYALTSPFTDTAFFVDGFTGVTGPEATSLGDLTITAGDFQTATTTFQASPANAVTPEPGSLLLLCTGFLGLPTVLRQRSKRTRVEAA